MTVTELITRLRQQGVRIRAAGQELEIDAPQGALTPELVDELTNRKAELLRLLSWSRRSEISAEVPLERLPRHGELPLSWAQQRLWFLDQLEPGSAAYNISWTVRLTGDLNHDAMRGALQRLVERHETLRTVFPAADGEPFQQVLPRLEVPLEYETLLGVPDEQFRAHLSQLAGRHFDLANGPLIRVSLLATGPNEHVLLVLIHHIVADGASMRILFRELAALYAAELSGDPVELDDLPVQYADYSVWQRRWLDGGEQDRQAGFWREQLKGLPPLLELPWDRPRSAAMRYRGASVLRVIPAGLTDQLRKLGREQGCTLFMVMLSAFYVLLMRYSGRTDLVVGTPLGGRPRTELEGLIGFFINTVVLRADLDGDPDFNSLLRAVREVALDAHAHQELPFEKLVELLQPQRELSYSPIFQVMFDLQEEPRWRLPVRGLQVVPEVVFSSRTSTFDLTLSVRQSENGLDAMFEYDTDLFDETTIERMAGHYQTLLEGIVLDSTRPISMLPLISPADRDALIYTWGSLSADYPDTSSLVDLVVDQATNNPDGAAVEEGQARLNYAELDRRSNQLAAYLIASGVEPRAKVAVCAPRSLNYFLTQLAILRAGAVMVPIDPDYPLSRLEFMLRDSGATHLLCDTDARPDLSGGLNPVIQVLSLTASCENASQQAAVKPILVPQPDDIAFVLYTSGSTGQPKGVELHHRGLVNYVHQLAIKTSLGPGDRVLQFANLSFDIALEECFAALGSGATLVIRDSNMTDSIRTFLDGCQRQQISWLSLPTAWWHELCTELDEGYTELPAELRVVLIGGEKAKQEAFRQWRARAGTTIRLINTYGPTEASIAASWAELTYSDPEYAGDIPIGHPVPNTRAWILDERGAPLPAGLPGELCIGGIGVARGYLGQPGMTAERFIPDPFSSHTDDRLYKTGDRARYTEDGRLLFLGRLDQQIKLRGHRIEPEEIESTIAALDGVHNAAAVLHTASGKEPQLVAYVQSDRSPNDLRRAVAQLLPGYLLPSAFVTLDEIPLNANGKIDRALLAARELMYESSRQYSPPRNDTETELAAIWSAVLQRESVGINDNFFELGGHSLLATRVVARVRDALGIDMPLREFFSYPTIAGIAERLPTFGVADRLRPVERYRSANGLPPLSWAQERLWVLDQLEPENVAYTLPWVGRLKGPLHIRVLQAALNKLMDRHGVLRTRFAEHNGEPVQIVVPSLNLPLQVERLKQRATYSTDENIRKQLQGLAEIPFDLHRGPLIRAHLIEISGQDHALLLLMHHIVADGWSIGVLCAELGELYNAMLAGRAAQLAELRYQYVDYAVWQRNWLSGQELGRQEKYWVEQLRDAPPLLSLPADCSRPPTQSFRGDWVSAQLDARMVARLKSLAADQDASLFMLLLACFKALILRHTGTTDILVGTPVAGRVRTELEPMVGCFLNTLVLRTKVDQRAGFDDLLRRVRQTTLDAYDNQNLPFEHLLDVLKPERSVAHAPLVQVMFNLHNLTNEQMGLADLSVETFNIDRDSAKFDLSVALVEGREGLQVGFEYNTDLFARATVSRMLRHYLRIIETAAEQPAIAIANVSLEQPYAPPRLHHAYEPIPASALEASLSDRFRQVVAQHGDRCAVESEGHAWTYTELDARADEVAQAIEELLPDCPGQRVGLLLAHDAPMLAGLLGVLKSGCAYVPLDQRAPAERLITITKHADLAAIVTTVELRSMLPAELDVPVVMVAPDSMRDSHHSRVAADPDALAYVLFTSGSTGQPKGVMQSHRNVLHHVKIYSDVLRITPEDRLSLIPAYGFDAAVMDIFGALLNGACIVPIDALEVGQAEQPAAFIEAQKLSVLHATPTVFRFLMNSTSPDLQFASVRAVVLGGEPAVARDFTAFKRHFVTPAVFVNGLGPSESTLATQFIANHETRLNGGVVPIGFPVPGTTAQLLDADGAAVPCVGELAICSAYVSPGYWNEPELTQEKFVSHAPSQQVTLYKSGDRARLLPDGQLAFLGRNDGQFKLRGQRIEPGEVESAINMIASVKESVVTLAQTAQGDAALVAYVIVAEHNSSEFSADELRKQLQLKLPDFLIPVAFMRIDSVPLTPNGKLDHKALPAIAWQTAASRQKIAPRNPLELKLAEIWSELLGISNIGIHDDFFRSGGHSLLATQLLARVRSKLDRSVSLKAFFQSPTIAELAAIIGRMHSPPERNRLRPRPAGASLPPLSWAQQRLWFLDRLDPGSATYNLHWAARLSGSLDRRCLDQALNDLVRRHESLRTIFGAGQSEPVQLILPELRIDLQVESLLGADTDRLHSRVVELVRQPFDLEVGPLLRCYLLESGANEAVLLLMMPHIVSDGWSMGVMFSELAQLYSSRLHSHEPDLPELPIQYADYALWQRQWLSGPELDRQSDFWKQQLADAPALLDLPLDFPRPPVQRYRGAWVGRQFDHVLLSHLHDLAAREGVTLFMVLLAAFKTLLLRYTGQEDLVIGTPVAGRRQVELEELIGFFLNTLALRTNLGGNPAFNELLRRVRHTTLDAYEHQDLPFEKLLEILQPARSMAHTPVVQVMFNLHNEPSDGLRLEGAAVSPFAVDRGTAKLDLSASLVESAVGLYVGFEYSTDIFEQQSIERLLDHYGELLHAVVSMPDATLADLPLTADQDASVPLTLQFDSDRQDGFAANEYMTVASRFEEVVAKHANRDAIRIGDFALTYAELDELSSSIAQQLVSLGDSTGNIGVLLGHDHMAIASLLACLKAGRAYVPLDHHAPAARLAAIMTDAGLGLILTDEVHRAALAGEVSSVPVLLVDGSGEKAFSRDRNDALDSVSVPEDLAYILFTSGSTGTPKGVMQSQRNLLQQVVTYTRSLCITSADRLTLFSQYGFDAAVMDIYGALLNGACLYPLDIRSESYTGEILDQMSAAGISILHATPTVFRLLMRQKVCRHDLETVRAVVLGGEETLSSDFALFKKQFAPPALFINGLGPSESTLALQFVADHATRLPGNLVPVGRPVAGVTTFLVDESGQPAGVSGEIVIESDCLSLGYWQDPVLSEARFSHAVGNAGSRRRYRTGDRARYLPDGQLVFLGRGDDQVKVRGHRIELAEIESVLAAVPDVQRCAVVAHTVGDDQYSVPDTRLAAYVVGSPDVATLREHLRNQLPDYMLPSSIVKLDALPVRSNGKLERSALPVPEWSQVDSQAYVAPRTEIEQRLATIWSEVLGVKRVGIHDDFFELGGHSLLAAQLAARIADSMQVGLPLRRLFDAPTVAALAEHVDALQWALNGQNTTPR